MTEYEFRFLLMILLVAASSAIGLSMVERTKKRWSKKKKKHWGQKVYRERNFGLINLYHKLITEEAGASYEVDDATMNNLELDEVFSLLDRTETTIGQQYLYHCFRTPNNSINSLINRDKLIEFFSKDAVTRLDVQYLLSHFQRSKHYNFPELFLSSLPSKPNWLLLVGILQALTITSAIGSFFQTFFFIILLIILPVNLFIHYYNKNKLSGFYYSFKTFSRLHKTCKQLHNMKLPFLDLAVVKDSLEKTKPIYKNINPIGLYDITSNNLWILLWLLLENLKVLLLIEVILFYSSLDSIAKNRRSMQNLFDFLGEIELGVSIASFRYDLEYFTKPQYNTLPTKQVSIKNIVHPLIEKCVPNDLSVVGNDILVTGSNMAGKTTFIKTIGINALLAQTFYTVMARSYSAPFFRIYSSVKIEDDILTNKSYFLSEAISIGNLIDKTNADDIQNLLIIDELFKGTNNRERIGASIGVLSYLSQESNLVLASTHDLELIDHLSESYDTFHFQELIKSEQLVFDYKLHKGPPTSQNAIKILKVIGYPDQIIVKAKEVLDKSNRSI